MSPGTIFHLRLDQVLAKEWRRYMYVTGNWWLSHYDKIAIVFLLKDGITDMEQPVISSDCNPVDYM